MPAGDRELDGGARLAADGHHPAHHSGSFSAWPRWADDLLAADPGDAAARPASRTAGACWRLTHRRAADRQQVCAGHSSVPDTPSAGAGDLPWGQQP